MKTVAIIQARMGSTRLPGKMTKLIAGRLVISYVFERAKVAKELDEVWLATTLDSSDDVLAAWANKNHVLCFRGSVNDVLDRYYQTALKAKADSIVRLTGDCPLLDPKVIDRVVLEYKNKAEQCAYVSNIHPPTYPDGLDVEVFSFSALEKASHEAKLQSEREHVTPYIWKNPNIFSAHNVLNTIDLSSERWTLDTREDFELINKILEELIATKSDFSYLSTLAVLNTHPEWRALNADSVRNAGYQKSIQSDE